MANKLNDNVSLSIGTIEQWLANFPSTERQ